MWSAAHEEIEHLSISPSDGAGAPGKDNTVGCESCEKFLVAMSTTSRLIRCQEFAWIRTPVGKEIAHRKLPVSPGMGKVDTSPDGRVILCMVCCAGVEHDEGYNSMTFIPRSS